MKIRARIEWKPAYCCLGFFWRRNDEKDKFFSRLDLWLCFVPCLPLHVVLWWDNPEGGSEMSRGGTEGRMRDIGGVGHRGTGAFGKRALKSKKKSKAAKKARRKGRQK